MNKVKYILHPGYVVASDGDRHFIGFAKLCMLYKVQPQECVHAYVPSQMRGRSDEELKTLRHLYPRADGNYKL